MFCDTSPKDSYSESSSSSPNTMTTTHRDTNACTTLSDSSPIKLNRSATVRRVITHSKKEEMTTSDDLIMPVSKSSEKYRKSIDSTYRHSLESISEYKTKRSFSSCLYANREGGSIDSTTSDYTDYARRHSSETYNAKDIEKTFISPSTSYLSWIESVNSEYFGNSISSNNDIVDVDNKVGEWNNFWLNYNSPRYRYLSSHYNKYSNEDKTADDVSDCKSTCSTHKDFNDKISSEQVVMTYDEITEILQCAQKITDILQKAVKRTDDVDHSRNDSYYSQPSNSYSDDIPKERAYSFMDPQDLQKQKQLLKPPSQPSSCINVLLATGVADILKRVINKRREVIAPDETVPNTPRSSFTDWASSK